MRRRASGFILQAVSVARRWPNTDSPCTDKTLQRMKNLQESVELQNSWRAFWNVRKLCFVSGW
jgi:hypothetical protein